MPEGIHLASLPGVGRVRGRHVRAMRATKTPLTAHLVVPAVKNHDALLIEIAEEMGEHFRIAHVTVQITTSGCIPVNAHSLE